MLRTFFLSFARIWFAVPALLLLSGAAGVLRGQEFLVKNINTQQETVGSAPQFFVPVGTNVFYFKANDGTHGTELWRSDGTAEGTALVADIAGDSANADPASLVNVNGTLFFTATDVVHGRELWKSDGTATGTFLVADIAPGVSSSNPTNLVAVSNLLFFTATVTNTGTELWVSDGTAVGTHLVRDINPGSSSSNPANLIAFNNILLFAANNGITNGLELWRSDGTTNGTVLVKDINPGGPSSNPTNFVVVNNAVFFGANGGTATGQELWKTDGTTAGTVLVKDVNPGSVASNPQNLVNVNGTLFFSAAVTSNLNIGNELWKSDGTSNGTVLVRDINPGTLGSNPLNLVNVNGTLFFTANGGSNGNAGTELWKSDGTSNGTVLVKDILPGSNGSGVTNLVNVNGTLFFAANEGTHGVELWKSDGTTAGTVMVKDIRPGSSSSSPQGLANINGTLVFSADDGVIGRELWRSDGTEAGTYVILNIRDSDNESSPANLVDLNGNLLFVANDGVTGAELWSSDGSFDGTSLLKDINSGTNGSAPANLVRVGDTVFFSANDGINGNELWKTDGSADGTVLVKDINPSGSSNPANLINFNGTLFFSASDPTNAISLWKSDGTQAGTTLVKSFNPGGTNANPHNFVVLGSTLFFTVTTPFLGTELWKSDGTSAGTVIVSDISAGPASSNPTNFAVFKDRLYFAATTSSTGFELYSSDGTSNGTFMVSDINPGTASSGPQSLTVVGDLLYFVALSTNGIELWATDGTSPGTFQVKNINPATTASPNSTPQNLINVNGTLFFSANDGANGFELWKSDGTDAGTVMVKDINLGAASSSPSNFFTINGILYFSATDGENGRELWQSDGTADGTFMVGDLTDDFSDSNPAGFTVSHNTLFFAAQTSGIGRELFGLVLNHPPVVAEPIPDQQGTVGASFSFTVPPETFADPDSGQTLTLSAQDLPPGIAFDPSTGSFSGTFAAAGQFTVSVTALDNGTPEPLSVVDTFTITVDKGTPSITWPTPADIVYGTALGSTQLNATANVSGRFVYTPDVGTVLHAGSNQTLSVTFTPESTNDYNSATASVSINVLKAPLAATAADVSRNYGAANPPFTINYTGFVNGDSSAVLDSQPIASNAATPASPVGTYAITLSGGSDNDYDIYLVNGTLTVAPAVLTVTAYDTSRLYGQPNPTFTGSIAGIQNNDNISATYASPATSSSLAGAYPIIPTLVDPDGKLSNYYISIVNGTLTITPAALTVTITGPSSGFVQTVNSNILFTGSFTKSGASESYLAWWTVSSDGMSDVVIPGVVSNGTVSAQVQFSVAGVYNFTLTVTNESGPSAVATNILNDLPAYGVIYDPQGGFVTGGGWFSSPAGAYTLDPTLTGKTTFGFVSKYQNGASVPSGQTQFQLQVADLNFHSTSYDWLVISGAKAQYRGSGTINGEGDYAFILTATDGQVNGGGRVDKLRMKIWEKQHNIIVYDNQLGASDSSDPTTTIQAGSIVIHKE